MKQNSGAPGSTVLPSTLGMILPLLLLAGISPVSRALAMSAPSPPQQPSAAPQSPFAGLIAEYLRRSAAGHSPTEAEITAMETLTPTPSPSDIRGALPLLLQALASRDTALRTFALTTFLGLGATQSTSGTPKKPDDAIPIFKPEVAKVVVPAIPAILAHLTDEAPQNRIITILVVACFTGRPPAELYPPLLAYLKTDAAVSATGLGVATALLSLGPISPDTAAALVRFMRRPDARDLRTEFVDIIPIAPNQSQQVNAGLLKYLDADDPALRARLILSLPQLDLAPDLFADTKARVTQLAESPNENLQVVTAAKAVAPCWTASKMSTGCPVYATP